MRTLEDAYAVFQNPYATYSDMQAAQAFIEANESLAPVQGLIAPEEGYTYGDIVPLRTNQTTGERELTVPMMAREGAQSLLNIAQGSQTGVVNPEDVMNVMPMGGAASLLDEGIEGGFAAGMFIGRGNKNANPFAFAQADEMLGAGKRPEEIYRETYKSTGSPILVGRDSQLREEVSDLNQIDASELAQAAQKAFDEKGNYSQFYDLEQFANQEYAKMFEGVDPREIDKLGGTPSIRMMSFKEGSPVDASNAAYNPVTNTVILNPVHRDPLTLEMRPKTEDELRSSLLHELQHKVQGSDQLSTGSNQNLAKKQFDETLGMFDTSDAFKSIQARADEIDSARPRFSDVNRAETAKYYDDLSRRDNVGQVARKIFNSAEWYRVGDSIVNELGPVPKRSGEARNEWLRQAAARLSNVFAGQVQDKSLLELDQKQLKSEYRKMYRKAYPSDSYETSNARRFVGDYLDELRSDTSPYTLYRRKLGETEARATQARENMTLEQRANVFPERSYDMNPDAMIIDQELFQDTPQGLLTLTRKTR